MPQQKFHRTLLIDDQGLPHHLIEPAIRIMRENGKPYSYAWFKHGVPYRTQSRPTYIRFDDQGRICVEKIARGSEHLWANYMFYDNDFAPIYSRIIYARCPYAGLAIAESRELREVERALYPTWNKGHVFRDSALYEAFLTGKMVARVIGNAEKDTVCQLRAIVSSSRDDLVRTRAMRLIDSYY